MNMGHDNKRAMLDIWDEWIEASGTRKYRVKSLPVSSTDLYK
jgi:hypothetical protein